MAPFGALGLWLAVGSSVALVHADLIRLGPTPGCAKEGGLKSGSHTIMVQDPELGSIRREFLLVVPDELHSGPAGGAPLVLGFHGQGGKPWDWGPGAHFAKLARSHGWVAVFPAGLNEHGEPDGTDKTWNTGTAGDDSTCLDGTTSINCMDSCKRLNKCGRCNWATCYSDVAFIEQLIQKLEQDLCLDSQRYFLVGESNGGMLTHYLIQELPGKFLAAAPVFGLPLVGYLVGAKYQLITQPEKARRTSMLQLYDRTDIIIPWQGGSTYDGWLYESMERALGVWAAEHRCSPNAEPVHSPYSGGPKHVACSAYPGCSAGGRVMFCMYDGHHGQWPDQPRAANLIWSFFEDVGIPTSFFT